MSTAAASYLALGAITPPPFTPAPRYWAGNMCGIHVADLPPVYDGASDPSLVLSWFYDRYNDSDRARIRAAWLARGYTHVVLSWPDSSAWGFSAQHFADTCRELIANGFYPCPFLCSKDFNAPDVPSILASIAPVVPLLLGVVPLVCVGWELSIWLSGAQVQALIDAIAPPFVTAQARVYVHFQGGYMSFPQFDGTNADFWALQVGKLTGVLAQKVTYQPPDEFRGWIHDCLLRMAGNFNMPADSGFGHPFDFPMLEISASLQFDGSMTEAQGDAMGQFAIQSPSESGPGGTVVVMGSGNGF